MTDTSWRRRRVILEEAQGLEPEAAAAFLRAAAKGDDMLAAELLAFDAEARDIADDFLSPPLGLSAPSLEERPRELAPGERVGPYRVEALLGRGGMATVHRAERDDGEFRQVVALKWVSGFATSEIARALFLRERQVLADLGHPHIARLLDGGHTDEGRPWLAMELIEGAPIDAWCADNALPSEARVRLLLDVAGAVGFAHARGVLHRDIKPSNVLVDTSGAVKLLDFGIAELAGTSEGLAANAFTPGFASPEQRRGETLTTGSDIYQLGRIAERLLAPAEGAPIADGELRSVVARATNAEVAARYASVEDFAADLTAWLKHEPVEARGGGAAYRLRKFVQRNRWAVVVAAVATAALVTLGVAALLRIHDERDVAEVRARAAEAALLFITEDLLGAAAPSVALGQDTTVLEAIDLARERAATRFRGQPELEAGIRLELARVLNELGHDEAALEEAERSITLYRSTSTPDSGALRGARLSRLHALVQLDRRAEAEAELRDLGRELDPLDDDGPWLRERLVLELARCSISVQGGEFEASLRHATSVRTRAEKQFGPHDRLSHAARLRVGDVLKMLGRHAEAGAVYRTAYELRAQTHPPDDPELLTLVHHIGSLRRHEGALDDAVNWLQRAREGRERVLGENSSDTWSTWNELATCLQELRRYDEAEPLFLRTLAKREEALGEENHFTRNSLSNLGLLYSLMGRLDEAEALYSRVLALERRLVGTDHPDTLALIHNVAGLERRRERYGEARQLHHEAIEGARARLGVDAWQVGLFLVGLARTEHAAGAVDTARRAFDDAIGVLERGLGPDHARTVRAREMRDELGLGPAQVGGS